ncbi:MAG TPA: adenylate/guanylate cyclase domain-containing protein [Polyangia bacterium]|jgi:adenylate cyclase|nr:adenylate/guanylate cyclase domain-containing protein [Polyangia bacterium]
MEPTDTGPTGPRDALPAPGSVPPPPSAPRRARAIRLRYFFALTVLGLALPLGVLFYLVWSNSRHAITEVSSQLQSSVSAKVARSVGGFLSTLDHSVGEFEERLRHGVVRPHDLASIELDLYTEMLDRENLAALAFTYGESTGYRETDDPAGDHERGELLLAPEGRGQLLVFRMPPDANPGAGQGTTPGASGRILTRHIHQENGRWVSDLRDRPAGGGFASAPWVREERMPGPGPFQDPTQHPSFVTPAQQRFRGRALWSDLAYFQLDEARPEAERRKVLSVQKAILDDAGRFLGVLKASMLSAEIDQITRQHVNEQDPEDPHRIFLCDIHGRLITRTSPADRFATLDEDGDPDPDGDLRVVSPGLPPPLGEVLRKTSMLEGIDWPEPLFTRVHAMGQDYLLTLAALPPGRTQGWLIGIVVPESYYLADLRRSRTHLMLVALLLITGILVTGGLSLRALGRGLNLLVRETGRMHRFEFAAAENHTAFEDMNAALASLEQAKTALRALGKYVPIDLVRQLYDAAREPTLGGELMDVSILFTDIKDFTTVSEQLDPDALAVALGRYLDVMTRTLQGCEGMIDKYIGDAVMVLWNVPRQVEQHPRKACLAALACTRALRELFGSPEWAGIPPWRTRFGLHRDTVRVGHFGAPDRLSFTAIGDGVNLASRLEGLNKQYGTWILVSETVRQGAGPGFLFRRLDRVAVKGKTRGVEVHELVGLVGDGESPALVPVIERYEAALEHYFGRRFAEALALLGEPGQEEDAPSRVLGERCRRMLEHPPPEDWNGIFVFHEK